MFAIVTLGLAVIGLILYAVISDILWYRKSVSCPICRGAGSRPVQQQSSLSEEACPTCNGLGRIPPSPR